MRARTLLLLLLWAGLVGGCLPIPPPPAPIQLEATQFAGYAFDDSSPRRVTGIDMLGLVQFETGYSFQSTPVGGLSAIAYDPRADHYYLLSDDRSQFAPARIYRATLDLADAALTEGDVQFLDVLMLTDADRNPFVRGRLDPEGLARTRDGHLFMSSEGDTGVNPVQATFLHELLPDGAFVRGLGVPDYFLPTPDAAMGLRDNLAFESLTITPDGQRLIVANENALAQDGPISGLEDATFVRMAHYELATDQWVGEYVYRADPVPEPPDPIAGLRSNGLSELLALDNSGTFLALERAFSVGKGNTIRLYEVYTQGAHNVAGMPALLDDAGFALIAPDQLVGKRLLLDFADLGIAPDNLEGMAFGPRLEDGRQTLVVVSDNNFNQSQSTQFIALALHLEGAP